MPRSAPEIFPGDGMSPASSGFQPAATATATATTSSSGNVLPTHFSSSAPEQNQVESQRRDKAVASVPPKGINYAERSNADTSAATSIEVRTSYAIDLSK